MSAPSDPAIEGLRAMPEARLGDHLPEIGCGGMGIAEYVLALTELARQPASITRR